MHLQEYTIDTGGKNHHHRHHHHISLLYCYLTLPHHLLSADVVTTPYPRIFISKYSNTQTNKNSTATPRPWDIFYSTNLYYLLFFHFSHFHNIDSRFGKLHHWTFDTMPLIVFGVNLLLHNSWYFLKLVHRIPILEKKKIKKKKRINKSRKKKTTRILEIKCFRIEKQTNPENRI